MEQTAGYPATDAPTPAPAVPGASAAPVKAPGDTPLRGNTLMSGEATPPATVPPAVVTSLSAAAPQAATMPSGATIPSGGTEEMVPGDLRWVWMEVRKRVFIKLPFSLGVADAMEAVVPIALDEDTFVCGLASKDYVLSSHLVADQVKNTIENILRQAAGRHIHFELIEGINLADWEDIKDKRTKAQEAVIAMAKQHEEAHHVDDVLNQIVSEIRHRVTSTRDRVLPQVRAGILLDMVPQLSDAEEMLFSSGDTHDGRRAMARAIDRIAAFLEVTPFELAIEIERHRRANLEREKAAAKVEKTTN